MHLLILTALYPPAVGGAATYFGDIVPRLLQRPEITRLTVLTERLPGQPRRHVRGKLQVLRLLPTRVSLPRRSWPIHAATYGVTQLWFMAYLPALVRRQGADLIHFHTRYRGRLFYAALRRCRVPVVADLRDKMSDPARLARVADRLLCCAEGVQRFAVANGFPAERTALVPIPFTPPEAPSPQRVDTIRRQHGVGREPYLLFVGDMTYNKGVYDLLEAYRRWRPTHPQARLLFVGVNREGDRFLRQVRQTRGAAYLGHRPHQEVLALMRGAEVVVLPSRSEGLPRVILEAVALGTKVICPPGIPEFERHLAEYALPGVDADAILEKLDALWESDSVPAYPFSEHDPDRVAEMLLEVYTTFRKK